MATTVTRQGCILTVTIRMEFQNNTGRLNNVQFQNLVNGWETAIENLWNGPNGHQHHQCCCVFFDVNTRIGAGTPNFHQVNVVAGPQTSTAGIGPATRNANWDDMDTGNVTAHETGHLMGLGDEYDYGGPGGAYRNLNPQPAGQPQSIMAQTWGNVAALQSHIDAIMRGLNAWCPWWCCIWNIFHRIGIWFSRVFLRVRLIESKEVPGGTAMANTVEEILKRIETGKPDALADGLYMLREKGREAVKPLIEALKRNQVLARWAAAAALGELKDTEAIPALEAALKDENLSVRIRAAQSLAKLGSTQGIPVLIAALESNEVMIGHPPELACDYANQVLGSVSGKSFGFDGSADKVTKSAAVKKWQAWWEENRNTFRIVTPR